MNPNHSLSPQSQTGIDRRAFLRQALILSVGFILILCVFAAHAQKPPEHVDSNPPKKLPSHTVKGTLKIHTDPSLSEVYIDGKLQGTTGADGFLPLSLKPGPYRLLIKHDEYEAWGTEIKIHAGETLPIDKGLTALYGYLLLDVTNIKPDAVIELDERVV